MQHGLLCGGDARTSAERQTAASPGLSAFAGARAAKREIRVLARGRSSSHATMRSILIAAAIATCCKWVFATPQYRVRRRPKARTPWESVPSTPARVFVACHNDGATALSTPMLPPRHRQVALGAAHLLLV